MLALAIISTVILSIIILGFFGAVVSDGEGIYLGFTLMVLVIFIFQLTKKVFMKNMALIKKLKKFFTGEVVYPVTSSQAVYDTSGARLDKILQRTIVASTSSVEDTQVDDIGLEADKVGKYTAKEINDFIAGPAFSAWWLMNNLEGWGGKNYKHWYKRQITLQKRIIERMREFGINPVLPGYCGMIPSNAKEKLGIDAVNTGLWCGYKRPFFILPNDSNFNRIADIYYSEQEKLFGKAEFFAIDPFHEGGLTEGVDMREAGKTILSAMKRCNSDAVWVAQGWQGNPNREMIAPIKKGDMLILDLHSESASQWEHYGNHDWAYCMLLNFGGNVGLHGKFDAVVNGFYDLKKDNNISLKGIGMTPEGIENNPMMFELLTELAWRDKRFGKDERIKNYVTARYGVCDTTLLKVWEILGNSIYNAPKENQQQGTHESVFCARPSLDVKSASKWANSEDYYNPNDIISAAILMCDVTEKYRGNNNFEYDLTDILRQAICEKEAYSSSTKNP